MNPAFDLFSDVVNPVKIFFRDEVVKLEFAIVYPCLDEMRLLLVIDELNLDAKDHGYYLHPKYASDMVDVHHTCGLPG